MEIPYVALHLQHQQLKSEILPEVEKIIDSGQFILGDSVGQFENAFAAYCGVDYAVGVGNGTDALVLAMQALGLGEGDEVITAPNSFVASASSIALTGATPVFADVNKNDMNIDPVEIEGKITPRTKAIMPVHLTGRPANMDAIMNIAQKYDLLVLEDAAQAVGATYNGQKVGSIGKLGAFSLHPLKNLSACGDGGMITTNDRELYNWLKMARNHGLKNRDECLFWSVNSRLDAIQAAILTVKLRYLEKWNERRRAIAAKYSEALASHVHVPPADENISSVFHAYMIQTDKRDELMQYLKKQGIDTKIHYPIAIHQQEAFRRTGENSNFPATEQLVKEILSLPVYPELTDEQVNYIIEKITEFFS